VADLAHLETLPARERTSGLAEIAKIALSSSPTLFEQLEAHATALARGDREALQPIVRSAIEAKIAIVRDDERESGLRMVLNLGHTLGHALEAHGGFSRWLHGEAVALGLVAELEVGVKRGWTPPALLDRTRTLLAALGLPSSVPHTELEAAWSYIGTDKKRSGNSVRLPVVHHVGDMRIERIRLEALRSSL
jgi:3-dehydroquinate synthetase